MPRNYPLPLFLPRGGPRAPSSVGPPAPSSGWCATRRGRRACSQTPVSFLDGLDGFLDVLRGQLLAADPELLGLYPTDAYVRHLDAQPWQRGYSWIGVTTRQIAEAITRRTSGSMLGRYHKLVLMELIRSLDQRIATRLIPASVLVLLRSEIQRIYRDARGQDDEFYHFSNALFLKDLGMCRLVLLPCGAELVEAVAGIPRPLLFRGGFTQLVHGLSFFLLRTRGFHPFYSLHLDSRRLEEFNPDGWDRTYVRIAELLALHPEVKGVFGTAWFYDPQLETISPHLPYLRQRRVAGGARAFRYGSHPDAIHDALAKSATRRRLHAEGRYLPTGYYVVWPRDDLLHWARRHRSAARARRGL